MSTLRPFTSRDLECLPDDGKRYEIIEGELYVSRPPHWHHQYVCGQISSALQNWSLQTGAGTAVHAPGLIFAQDNDVVPDIAWVSSARLPHLLDDKGHLRAAPELVVEVLSPGPENERRDRELKLSLCSRQGVQEYWIVDWRLQTVQDYRRSGVALEHVATLGNADVLTCPLLPGFTCRVSDLWELSA
jgi:Uma2 family endonuclease